MNKLFLMVIAASAAVIVMSVKEKNEPLLLGFDGENVGNY